MFMESAFLLLGSNMGNSNQILQEALRKLELKCGTILSHSKMYSSEPWGFEAQCSFLNMAIEIETELEPQVLLYTIHQIESELGRTRVSDGKYHSRTIDIDIIFYGNRVVESQNLIIPHPKMHLRRFVLMPLSQIAPNYIHPTLKVSVNVLLNQCLDKSQVLVQNFPTRC